MSGSELRPLRVLFLAPFAPRQDGAHGGSRAIARLMAGIAERHEVALVYLRTSGEPTVDDGLASRCAFVESVPLGFGGTFIQWWRRRLRVAIGLLCGRPRWVSNWREPAYARRVAELVRAWQPNVVQAESHVMGQYLAAVNDSSVRRVLVEHDPGIVSARDQVSSRKGVSRMLARIELTAWHRYEAAVLRAAQVVVVFTERDRVALTSLAPNTVIETIPLGVDLPPSPLDPTGTPPPRLLFVGNFVHPPNVDAALRLMDEIFPRVQQAVPDCHLEIVGAGPPAAILERSGGSVVVTGAVPDVRPYLDQAALVIVPLRLGGGMRVKVLEALAAGKAVVASPLAAEGLTVTDGEHLRLASTDEQFAATVIELLRAPDQRAALAARGRRWAAEDMDPSLTVRRYEQLYEKLVG